MKWELQEMSSKAPSFLTERYLNGNEGLESREVPLPRRFRGANFWTEALSFVKKWVRKQWLKWLYWQRGID